jgi:hypothetical protein
MKRAVQVVAGLNGLFGIVVGLMSVAAPRVAAGAFKVDGTSVALLALIRMFGGLLAASGIISSVIARNPDESRTLIRAYAACLAVNVAADIAVIGAGEMQFAQLASGMLLEALLAILLVVYQARRDGARSTT